MVSKCTLHKTTLITLSLRFVRFLQFSFSLAMFQGHPHPTAHLTTRDGTEAWLAGCSAQHQLVKELKSPIKKQ